MKVPWPWSRIKFLEIFPRCLKWIFPFWSYLEEIRTDQILSAFYLVSWEYNWQPERRCLLRWQSRSRLHESSWCCGKCSWQHFGEGSTWREAVAIWMHGGLISIFTMALWRAALTSFFLGWTSFFLGILSIIPNTRGWWWCRSLRWACPVLETLGFRCEVDDAGTVIADDDHWGVGGAGGKGLLLSRKVETALGFQGSLKIMKQP